MPDRDFEVVRVQPGGEPLWQSAVASILSEQDREGRVASESELSSALRDPRCILFLALSQQRPVGLLSAYVFPDVAGGGRLAYLYDIEVLEPQRRAGIGTALVEALTRACTEQDVRLIWAGTERENAAARRTFERTGAALEGESYAEYEWELDDDE